MSEDPIRFEAGDANLARYVGNSPPNATDPSGLALVMPNGAPAGGSSSGAAAAGGMLRRTKGDSGLHR